MKKILSVLCALFVLLQLSAGALAMGYVPSIEQHETPEIKDIVGPDGESYAAIITSSSKKFLRGVSRQRFSLTCVGASSAATESIKLALTNAFSEIQKAVDLDALAPGASAQMEKQDPDATLNHMVMTDLLDVRVLDDEDIAALAEEGNLLQFTLDFGLQPEQVVVVASKLDDTDWKSLGLDVDYQVNEDDTITFWLDACGIIALAVDDETVDTNEGAAEDSPKTADRVTAFVVAGACLVALGGCLMTVYFVKTRRRS